MSRRIRAVPSRTLIGAIAASSLLALAAAPAASAAKIYTCVNDKSGAMRLVSAKTKCRHGERKVSWNAAGPAGAPGAAGALGSPGAAGSPGSPGANGSSVDYASSSFGPTTLTEGGEVVLAKTIPAGSYLVSGASIVGANATKPGVFVAILCELVDTTGTPALVEPPAALDLGEWAQTPTLASGSEYEAVTTLQLQTQLTTTQPTTLALMCAALTGAKEAKILAFSSNLSALQTTANK